MEHAQETCVRIQSGFRFLHFSIASSKSVQSSRNVFEWILVIFKLFFDFIVNAIAARGVWADHDVVGSHKLREGLFIPHYEGDQFQRLTQQSVAINGR